MHTRPTPDPSLDRRSVSSVVPAPIARALVPALAALLAVIGGCQSGDSTFGSSSETMSSAASTDPTAVSSGPIDLDERYVIGPEAARKLGYRIDWQVRALPEGEAGFKSLSTQHDSLLVLDERNYLSRYRRDDGQRLWRIPVADVWDEILGVTFVAEADRIFLTTGGALLELDALTGSTVGRQGLEKVANTEPVLAGTFLIYGARNGQAVWHAFPVAYQWRAYQVSRSIRMKPLLYESVVLCVGNDGRIMALDVASASQMWNKRLLDAVVADPIAGNGAIFLSGTDQYLYCFDAFSGRTLWSHLTTSPLTDSPTLVENRIYQQIPGEGLACFDAYPLDDPDGEMLWTSRSVRGDVVTRRGPNLLAWDGDARQLSLVNPGGGTVVTVIDLPQVRRFLATSTRDGSLFAIGDDGRVERLVPRN